MKLSKLTKKLLYVTLCGAATFYVYAESNNPKSLSSAVNPNWAVLGAPTFEQTAMPTSSTICMDTTNETIGGNPSAGLNFSSVVKKEQLNSTLNLGVCLELPFLESYGVTVNPNANFASSAVNSEYTYNYTYLYTYNTDAKLNTVFGIDNLNSSGKAALDAGQNAFFFFFFDSFVSGLNAGVVLAVNVSITLLNKEQATAFAESFNATLGQTPLVNIAQAISTSESSIGQNSIMTISVLQNGGTPESLSTLLNYSNNDGGFFSQPCQVSDVTSCENKINAVIGYASTLPSQIKDNNGNLVESNLYFSAPTLTSYSSIGLNVPAPQRLPQNVLEAQYAVVEAINSSQESIEFLQNYLHSNLNLSPDVTNFINSQTKRLQDRVNYIAQVSVDCFNANAASCPSIVETIKNRLSTSKIYAFDKTQYNYLRTAIRYVYNGKATNIVPVSFYGDYNTLAGGYPDEVGLSATVYRTPEPNSYITEIDIPDKDYVIHPSMNRCFPVSDADKNATSRTFSCTDGLFKKFQLQFQAVPTSI